MKKLLSILILVAIFVMGMSFSAVAEQETFVLGTSQPLSGTNAGAGADALNALTLAVDEINAAGGLLGKYKVEIVAYDDQGTPEEAVKVATKLIEVDHVDAVIGSCVSSCVLASAGALNDNKIVTFGTGTSPTWMAQGWEYVFRACMNADFGLPTMVDYWEKLGIGSIALFAGQDDAATAAAETIKKICAEKGIAVLAEESYVEGDTDFSGQCVKMISSGAEAMVISVFGTNQPQILKQLRQFGYDGLVWTKDMLQANSLEVAGDAGNYCGFAYPYLTYTDLEACQVANIKEFLTKYVDNFGVFPNEDVAYRVYDSCKVLFTAIENAGTIESDAVRQAINQITGFPGLGGTLDFSQGDREGLHGCSVYITVDGEYILFDEWIASGGYDEWLNR